mgnify:CR=1 FL=1
MTADIYATLPHAAYRHSPALYQSLGRAELALEFPAFTAAAVDQLYDFAVPLSLAIPAIKLDPAERRRLRGYTYHGSVPLAYLTGRALIGDERHFPGTDQVGEALQARAGRATVLFGVSKTLKELAQRLDDLALYDLGTATRDAMALHKSNANAKPWAGRAAALLATLAAPAALGAWCMVSTSSGLVGRAAMARPGCRRPAAGRLGPACRVA